MENTITITKEQMNEAFSWVVSTYKIAKSGMDEEAESEYKGMLEVLDKLGLKEMCIEFYKANK